MEGQCPRGEHRIIGRVPLRLEGLVFPLVVVVFLEREIVTGDLDGFPIEVREIGRFGLGRPDVDRMSPLEAVADPPVEAEHCRAEVGALVVPSHGQLARGKGQRRHELMAQDRGGVIDGSPHRPGLAVGRGREHDPRGTVRPLAPLGPGHIDDALFVDGHRRIAVRPEGRSGGVSQRGIRRLIEGSQLKRRELGHDLRALEGRPLGPRPGDHDGARVLLGVEPPPGDIDVAVVPGIDGDRRSLMETAALVQDERSSPRFAAVDRKQEIDRTLLGPRLFDEGAVGDVDVVTRDRLPADRDQLGPRLGGVQGQPGLIDENRGHPVVRGQDLGVDILDGIVLREIAGLGIVLVDEPGDEESAVDPAGDLGPVEGDAAVVEHAARAGADDRVGGGREAPSMGGVELEGRGQPRSRRVLGKSGQERRGPGLSAVGGLVETQPCVRSGGQQPIPSGQLFVLEGHVDRAVIVGSADKVEGIERRDGDRRLILPLEPGIAVGQSHARYHVDVSPRGELLFGSLIQGCGAALRFDGNPGRHYDQDDDE